ncbi:MBOAT, membrane-bound O-acyltransferase family-domain-containing protein [Obelidium mucronatum]|nr:MBOAT, membrane-bound O-acyltransferase family-domain-containing protein [Obelidium mucronatum]KAI9334136.1 MBOAT, membrane-bound O-acyltransferase family-domain-containing protein [Obelidium mucronatum]
MNPPQNAYVRIADAEKPEATTKPILTRELYAHTAVTALCMAAMLWCIVSFSAKSRPEFASYAYMLSPSWINSQWFVDNSDSQYASFRGNLRILIPLMALHVVLSNTLQSFYQSKGDVVKAFHTRTTFTLIFSVVFFLVYNGPSGFLKLCLALALNYYLVVYVLGKSSVNSPNTFPARLFSLIPIISWIFGMTLLVFTNYYRGFQFGWISSFLSFLDSLGSGINHGWFDPLRFCFLRMISFDLDFYWKVKGDGSGSNQQSKEHTTTCQECNQSHQCSKSRIETPLDRQDYNLVNYFAYLLYIPLYLAGPIISYNDFIHQLKSRPPSTTPKTHSKQILTYIARWVCSFLLMELFIHSTFVIAIAKSGVWKQTPLTAFEVACLGYFNLKHIWLKLLVIWRFFRLWAMLDGIETVENMNRCMTNNYSASGFWRSWHRSFNRWIIRYIYVPMGGSKGVYLLNLLVTFTFVAVWHDLNLNLLAWGWLISLSIIPETLAMKYFPHKRLQSWAHYKHVCGLGAVANILLMIAVNIIGFGAVAGGAGSKSADGGIMTMIPLIFNANNLITFLGIFVFFFCLSQVQFAYREWEVRKGGGVSARD